MKDDKTKYKFTTIKDLMDNVLQKNKLESGINQVNVNHAWRKVMGEGVWIYTQDVKLIKDKLTIYYKSSAIREEHSYKKEQIITMLNAYLKTELIKKIRLL